MSVVACCAVGASASQAAVLAHWGTDATLSAGVRGIAVAPSGEVFVADGWRSRVAVFTRAGLPVRAWGASGGDPGEFRDLAGIAVAPGGDVLTVDRHGVQRFSSDGMFDARFGAAEIDDPGGIAVGPDGTIYVTESRRGRVLVFSPSGDLVAKLGGGAGGPRLHCPQGIAVDADGSLLVADTSAGRIVRLSPAGDQLAAWPAPWVHGVAVAADGSVLATDAIGRVVRRFDSSGAPTETIGAGWSHTAEPGGSLVFPSAVATDCRGAVYVADHGAERIHVFGAAGLAAPPCIPQPPLPPPPAPQAAVAGVVAASAPLAPVLGRSAVAEPVSGTVLVRSTASGPFHTLRAGELLPGGAEIDATDGVVQTTFATGPSDLATYGPTQVAHFWGGVFNFVQSGTTGRVDLELTGAQPSCDGDAQASAKSKVKKKRYVWGSAKGKFRTSGNNGAATVRGTIWLTEDRCEGTLFKIKQGLVDVRDFGRHKTVQVSSGESYLARVGCVSRRDFDIRPAVPAGATVRRVEVRVNGRIVKTSGNGNRSRARIDLRGRPKQRVLVRIRVVLTNGVVLKGTRTYRTCRPALPDAGPPSL